VREIRWKDDEDRRKIVSDRFTKSSSAKRRSDGLRSLVMAAGYQGALIWPGQNRGNIQT